MALNTYSTDRSPSCVSVDANIASWSTVTLLIHDNPNFANFHSDDILRIYDEDANADLLTNICGRFSSKPGFQIRDHYLISRVKAKF